MVVQTAPQIVQEQKQMVKVEEKVEPVREQTEIEKVWGNVLLKVKERNMFALSNALTNVVEVKQIGATMFIKTNDLDVFICFYIMTKTTICRFFCNVVKM